MSAYYNENDDYAATWLENLIKRGLIADGVVDRRSIEDVAPNDVKGFTQCHFFAGIGIWSYALRLSGWPDDRPIWTGSCPCQPFSQASKAHGTGKGFDDERHLWPSWEYLISECRPATITGEQVGNQDGLAWLDVVSSDLETQGYAFGAVIATAAGAGAPHIRQRIWFFADACGERVSGLRSRGSVSQLRPWRTFGAMDLRTVVEVPFSQGSCYPQPLIRKTDAGFANRVGRMRAYGNGMNASCCALFLQSVMDCYEERNNV